MGFPSRQVHRSPQPGERNGLLNLTLIALFHSDPVFAGGGGTFDDGVFGGHRALFLRNDHGLELGGGGIATPALAAVPGTALSTQLKRRFFADLDLAPDLGARIGSLTWYRGVRHLHRPVRADRADGARLRNTDLRHRRARA
jgi:hypothetical protein